MTAKHKPTDEWRRQVESMTGFGLKHEQIAAVLQIDPKTLRKHYRYELDVGMAKAHAKVGESLYKMATNGNVTAAIWFSKAQMGWAETVKHAGDKDNPLRLDMTMTEVARVLGPELEAILKVALAGR